jgi:tubulin polyglutamylase TTLL5
MPNDTGEYQLLVETLEAHGFRRAQTAAEEAAAILLWCGTSSVPHCVAADGSFYNPPHAAVNRLGRGLGTCITHKDRLVASLKRGGQLGVAPRTFTLPRDLLELQQHCEDRTDLCMIAKPFKTGRGRGIFVTRDPLGDVAAEKAGGSSSCVCQDYVSNPLCVDGHKLDLRLFVLVTGDGISYLNRAGYVRFAAKPFSMTSGMGSPSNRGSGDGFDPFIHLTYINSHNKKDHRIQRAKEWTVEQLLEYLSLHPEYGQVKADMFWASIQQLVHRTIACLPIPANAPSAASAPASSSRCTVEFAGNKTACVSPPSRFELFGFDVLPDDNLRPWLLEVNGQPHLGSVSSGGGRVFSSEHEAKGRSIADTLTMALASLDFHEELARKTGWGACLQADAAVGGEWWGSGD